MNRTFVSFAIDNNSAFKQQMLNWASRFNICCFLDNNNYPSTHHSYECILAIGGEKYISANAGNAYQSLKDFYYSHNDWMFGHFGYDLKNETDQFVSQHPDNIGFPDLFFFIPVVMVKLKGSEVFINGETTTRAQEIFNEITGTSPTPKSTPQNPVRFSQRFSQDEYIKTVKTLQRHILRGDCYEINFCQEFYATASIDPASIYRSLGRISPNPFSAFYKMNDKFLLCASPERYLKKEGSRLISQPIKGTWERNLDDAEADNANKIALKESIKERSENVMVVDLVRNDLSIISEEGSVFVEELYGIYTFPQVHQMISTVIGTIQEGKDWIDTIQATFPMGSMTGAPKKRVMGLIEQYERTRRGIFSGAVGYVDPEGDCDFNVVIRSILYNETKQYISCQVGSAITFYSNPKSEYEECLLKVEAIKKLLETPE